MPPDRPFFSVVMNAYNSEATVGKAVASVLSQSFSDFELIVVDDGSTDSTQAVVSGYLGDPRVSLITQSNRGCPAARQKGISHARGEYVVLLDSDDEALPDWLAAFAGRISAAGDDVLCSGAKVMSGNDSREIMPVAFGPAFGNRTGLFLAGTFAVRRSVLVEAGGYVEGSEPVDHTDLLYRLMKLADSRPVSFGSIFRPLVVLHKRPDEPYHPEAVLRGALYLLARYPDHFQRDPKTRGTYLAIAGVNSVRLGRLPEARAYFGRAFLSRPFSPGHLGRYLATFIPALAFRLWRPVTGTSKLSAAGPDEKHTV